MRLAVFSIAATLTALAALGPVAPEPALACSMVPGSLESSAAYAELVVVGEVVEERPAYMYDTFVSVVDVAATLKGDAPGHLTLDGLGHLGADCSGGPHLAVGERVLLFLHHPRRPVVPGGPPGDPEPLQIMGWDNGKYLLDGGAFVSRFAEPARYDAADAIERVAAITNSPLAEVDAALAFAGAAWVTAEPTAAAVADGDGDDGGASDWVPPVLAGGAAMALATALGGWYLMRRGG